MGCDCVFCNAHIHPEIRWVCALYLIALIYLSSFSASRIQCGKWPVFLRQWLYGFLLSWNLDGLGDICNFTVDPGLWSPHDHAAHSKQQIWWSQRSCSVSSTDRIAMDWFSYMLLQILLGWYLWFLLPFYFTVCVT